MCGVGVDTMIDLGLTQMVVLLRDFTNHAVPVVEQSPSSSGPLRYFYVDFESTRQVLFSFSSNFTGLLRVIQSSRPTNHLWPTYLNHHYHHHSTTPAAKSKSKRTKKYDEAKENLHLPATRFELANITVVVF